MPELPYKKIKPLAEQQFVEFGKDGKEIAEYWGVSEATISKWRKELEWDRKREELFASPHKLKQVLFRELQNLAAGNDKSFDADGMFKIFKIIEGLNDRTSVQVCVSVFKEIDDWMINEEDSELLTKMMEKQKKFIMYKASKE